MVLWSAMPAHLCQHGKGCEQDAAVLCLLELEWLPVISGSHPFIVSLNLSILVDGVLLPMASRELIIINRLGLHARAAAKFVTLASEFKAVVEVSRDSQRVNGKSIMGVMMLAASKGTQIVIHTEGADEDLAIEALAKLVNERFGEEV